jgi:integrase
MRKLTLGRAEAIPASEARRQARERMGKIAAGEDPADEKLAYRTSSLRAAYESFKAQHLPDVSRERARSRERIFERHFLPKLGDKVLSEISRGEIKEIVDKIGRKHKIAACNAHRGFSAFLSWCLDRGLIENHVLRGSKLPAQYRPRERTLNNEELIAVWKACDELPQIWKTYFRMLIATGQRRTEVAGMHWDEIDIDRSIWTLPAHRTKNRHQHIVPISPLMMTVLQEALGKSGYVFPSPLDRKTPLRCFGRPTDQLRSKAQVTGFRLHDLRRTVASIMGQIEVAPHVIEAILNHKSGVISGIAAIYNKYGYEREKALGLRRYGEYIAALVQSEQANGSRDEGKNVTESKPAAVPARFPRLAHG